MPNINLSGAIYPDQVRRIIGDTSIRYDLTQSLTEAQKAVARANLGASTSIEVTQTITANNTTQAVSSAALYSALALKEDKYITRVSADDYIRAAGQIPGTGDNRAGIQAAINAVGALGGGIVRLPQPAYGVGGTLLYLKGVHLEGNFDTIVDDTQTPYLRGTQIYPLANMSAIISQADLSAPLHSIGMRQITINGRNGTYTVPNLVQLSMINSKFVDVNITNGSGDGFAWEENSTAAWINWFDRVSFTTFPNGRGMKCEGTDSWFDNCYVSGCLVGVELLSSGAVRFSNSTVEVNTTGVRCSSNAITTECLNFFTTNYFDLNDIALDITKDNVNAQIDAGHVISNNQFHRSTTGHVRIGNNIRYGNMEGNVFDASGSYDVSFGGTNNTGWTLDDSHRRSVSSRFVNLPADAWVASSGNGQLNRFNSVVVSSVAANVSVADTVLNVWGGTTVDGRTNVISVRGLARNNPGFDVHISEAAPNGNSYDLNVVDGKSGTTAVAFTLSFRDVTCVQLDQNRITFSNKPLSLDVSQTPNHADDTAAAAGGVPVGGIYRTGSILKIRVS